MYVLIKNWVGKTELRYDILKFFVKFKMKSLLQTKNKLTQKIVVEVRNIGSVLSLVPVFTTEAVLSTL